MNEAQKFNEQEDQEVKRDRSEAWTRQRRRSAQIGWGCVAGLLLALACSLATAASTPWTAQDAKVEALPAGKAQAAQSVPAGNSGER